jgi:hypothetical protein
VRRIPAGPDLDSGYFGNLLAQPGKHLFQWGVGERFQYD